VDENPIREIKPVVVPAQFFVLGSLLSGFISLFLGVVVGFIVWEVSAIEDVSSPPLPWTPYIRQWGLVFGYGVTVFALFFIVSMVLLGLEAYKGPRQTIYSIYSDRMEYCEGLWTRKRRTLPFDQVIDVELTEGILQQTQAVGTVSLITKQHRVMLTNVPHPKEVYDLIRAVALKQSRT